MKFSKRSPLSAAFLATALLTLTTAAVQAASHAGAPMAAPGTAATAAKGTTPSADMAEGEIRKVDMDSKKITIKHGPIKNLDMPGMTMVFQTQDAAVLAKAKTGDKIRFKADKIGGAFVVTEIEAAK